MKKSYDQTFRLTTSKKIHKVYKDFNLYNAPTARFPQSALTPVRSVECGLFA